PGGSGQVGTILARALHAAAHDVVVLSRRPLPQPWHVVAWDGLTAGPWVREVNGSDVVINLTGRSVNCRSTEAHRREIVESRVVPTRLIGAAIGRAARPPRVWLQASTATIYAHRYDAANDEATGLIGGDESDAPPSWKFSIDVATAWERAFDEAITPRTRKVALRSAMVMGPDRGGLFETFVMLVRRGLGGAAGDGRQFVSWIHFEDFVRATEWLIDHEEIEGPVNISSPHPLPYREFMRALREASGIPVGLASPTWMLKVGAVLMQTETELVLKSRRVVPGRLLEAGFAFKYADWPAAVSDLYRRWMLAREMRGRAA
ncbi:MAG: TIGR01777 family oxidoreductase, partial [Acidobacteriota bacterium]